MVHQPGLVHRTEPVRLGELVDGGSEQLVVPLPHHVVHEPAVGLDEQAHNLLLAERVRAAPVRHLQDVDRPFHRFYLVGQEYPRQPFTYSHRQLPSPPRVSSP